MLNLEMIYSEGQNPGTFELGSKYTLVFAQGIKILLWKKVTTASLFSLSLQLFNSHPNKTVI